MRCLACGSHIEPHESFCGEGCKLDFVSSWSRRTDLGITRSNKESSRVTVELTKEQVREVWEILVDRHGSRDHQTST
jgi:hypothetical protein